jgi:hypothetical protein
MEDRTPPQGQRENAKPERRAKRWIEYWFISCLVLALIWYAVYCAQSVRSEYDRHRHLGSPAAQGSSGNRP